LRNDAVESMPLRWSAWETDAERVLACGSAPSDATKNVGARLGLYRCGIRTDRHGSANAKWCRRVSGYLPGERILSRVGNASQIEPTLSIGDPGPRRLLPKAPDISERRSRGHVALPLNGEGSVELWFEASPGAGGAALSLAGGGAFEAVNPARSPMRGTAGPAAFFAFLAGAGGLRLNHSSYG